VSRSVTLKIGVSRGKYARDELGRTSEGLAGHGFEVRLAERMAPGNARGPGEEGPHLGMNCFAVLSY
jgi:hypothetical protein